MRAYTRVSIAAKIFPTKKVNDSDGLNFVPASILRSLASKNHDDAAFPRQILRRQTWLS
jgi:hypothetical protein